MHEGTLKTAHFADFFLPPLSTCGRSSGTAIADSHARGPHTRKLWGTKQCKTAGKMTTSLLNLLGAPHVGSENYFAFFALANIW